MPRRASRESEAGRRTIEELFGRRKNDPGVGV